MSVLGTHQGHGHGGAAADLLRDRAGKPALHARTQAGRHCDQLSVELIGFRQDLVDRITESHDGVHRHAPEVELDGPQVVEGFRFDSSGLLV